MIIQNSLYLLKDPKSLISSFSTLLDASGYLLVTEPNFGNLQTTLRRLFRAKGFQYLGSFDRSQITPVTLGKLRRWMESAGLNVERIVRTPDDTNSARLRSLRSFPLRFSSKAITVLAQCERRVGALPWATACRLPHKSYFYLLAVKANQSRRRLPLQRTLFVCRMLRTSQLPIL